MCNDIVLTGVLQTFDNTYPGNGRMYNFTNSWVKEIRKYNRRIKIKKVLDDKAREI